ncbi:hypothetical protein BaRGS_00015612, partial [Batillaria attramentaria]
SNVLSSFITPTTHIFSPGHNPHPGARDSPPISSHENNQCDSKQYFIQLPLTCPAWTDKQITSTRMADR